MISCAEITDIFPPLIKVEQSDGILRLTVKDDEGIEKVTVKITNSTWNKVVWDTSYLVIGRKELIINKGLTMSGNHIAYIKAYDVNGNFYDKENTSLNKISPILDSISLLAITQTTARVNCKLIENGGDNLISIGFCISKLPNSSLNDSNVNVTLINFGDFEHTFQNLNANTKYYVRSFALNSIGISYSNEINFTTNEIPAIEPIITTKEITNITLNSASTGGNVQSDGGSEITRKGICYATHSNPNFTDSVIVNGNGNASYNTELSSLLPNTKYYVRAFATNSIGNTFGNELIFTTNALPVILPTVTTSPSSSITINSFRIGGSIISDGNSAIINRGICYSKSTNPTINDSVVYCGNGIGAFDTVITQLSSNTKYYARAFASNSKGMSYGDELSITTLTNIILPSVSTTSISSITYTSAKSGGLVSSDGGSAILVKGICYSISSSPTVSNSVINNGSGIASYVSNLTGLLPGQKYYVRAFATNSIGTAYGEELSFTTNSYSIPTITTASATNITQTTATVGGNVTNDGGKPITSRGVCYSLTTNPTILDSNKVSGSGLGSFSIGLTKLLPTTTYYIRAYATNAIGTSYGNIISITTSEYVEPTVITNNVINISRSQAELQGEITNDGGSAITSRGFYYGTVSPVNVLNSNLLTSGSGSGLFNSTLSNLSPNTRYYVRAFAVNNAGVIKKLGNEVSFITDTIAVPIIFTNTNILNLASTTVQIGGDITDNGGGIITQAGVCFSVNNSPTINDSIFTTNVTSGVFSVNLTKLIPNTTYYLRSYAINSAGITYGNQISFKTKIIIGDDYQGGKVTYILTPSDPGYIIGEVHGLIVSNNFIGGVWSYQNYFITTNTILGSGNQNTNSIVTQHGVNTYAAYYCYNSVENGYSDWYLPSKDELAKVIQNSNSTGIVLGNMSISSNQIWSSSQFDINRVYVWGGSGWDYSNKIVGGRLLPVRSF